MLHTNEFGAKPAKAVQLSSAPK